MQPTDVTGSETTVVSHVTQPVFGGARLALGKIAARVSQGLNRRRDLLLLLSSGLWDESWYLDRYDDVRIAGIDAAGHFLDIGGLEGRSPCALFDSTWYLNEYPDVKAQGVNPLIHYVRLGAKEGRRPNIIFDSDWYLAANPDVRDAGINPLTHYLQYGANEGREPSSSFDSKWYVSRYPEAHGENPLAHYLESGASPWIAFEFNYFDWVAKFDTFSDSDRNHFRAAVEQLACKPLISVVMPVYNTDPIWLERAIESVRRQLYPHWELCISDDASTRPEMREILSRYAESDARIKVIYREKNGHICANTNSALSLASGEFVALLDCDDELSEHALFWIAKEINQHADVDLIYSDEDKLDERGRRYQPYFKPDWNPALILSQNCFSHVGVFRRSLINEAGGFRQGFEGSQDHDLVLRCAERTSADRIRHIPRVLYHWRAISGSTASREGVKAKPYARDAGREAIEEHLHRIGVAASVEPSSEQFYQVQYKLPPSPPLVSVISICADSNDDMTRSIDRLLSIAGYADVQVIVGRLDEHTLRQAQGSLLCLLDPRLETDSERWLEKLVTRACLPGIGVVTPRLADHQEKIDPAATLLPFAAEGRHTVKLSKSDGGYIGCAALEQDVSVAPLGCLVVGREALASIGGVDSRFDSQMNIDLCLRMRARGWRILITPEVDMRAPAAQELPDIQRVRSEQQLLRAVWGDQLENDPFYNPNLSLTAPYGGLALPSRISKLPTLE
ncbi:MAG TPA: glycosyltransferase [Candidatus Obscuribacterales bacterium]